MFRPVVISWLRATERSEAWLRLRLRVNCQFGNLCSVEWAKGSAMQNALIRGEEGTMSAKEDDSVERDADGSWRAGSMSRVGMGNNQPGPRNGPCARPIMRDYYGAGECNSQVDPVECEFNYPEMLIPKYN